jgi:hypothetical protein
MTTDPVDHAQAGSSQCWCCGVVTDSAGMVHLGNHPEVTLCLPCARWAAKQAWEIEDRGRTGPLAQGRDRLRAARRRVMHRGWQHNRVFGRPLRWLGKRLP